MQQLTVTTIAQFLNLDIDTVMEIIQPIVLSMTGMNIDANSKFDLTPEVDSGIEMLDMSHDLPPHLCGEWRG